MKYSYSRWNERICWENGVVFGNNVILVYFSGNCALCVQFSRVHFFPNERWKIKAPDLAIPFLFIGIHELSKDSYDESIMPYFVISILLLGVAVALFQAYYYGEILYRRYFKMFWRLTFLLTFVLYVLLILLNISHYLL